MKKYWNETIFDAQTGLEDNRGKIWSSGALDELAPGEIEGMGLHMAEI